MYTDPELFTAMCINKKSLPFSILLLVQKVYCFLCPQTSFPQCGTKDIPFEGLAWQTNTSSKINCILGEKKMAPEKLCSAPTKTHNHQNTAEFSDGTQPSFNYNMNSGRFGFKCGLGSKNFDYLRLHYSVAIQ